VEWQLIHGVILNQRRTCINQLVSLSHKTSLTSVVQGGVAKDVLALQVNPKLYKIMHDVALPSEHGYVQRSGVLEILRVSSRPLVKQRPCLDAQSHHLRHPLSNQGVVERESVGKVEIGALQLVQHVREDMDTLFVGFVFIQILNHSFSVLASLEVTTGGSHVQIHYHLDDLVVVVL
jgi:hypothetical protein